MNFVDKLTYFYIKNIKCSMICPVCKHDLFFSKHTKSWICNNCYYELPEAEFLDDFIFWFCDGCETYLNIQKSFDKKSKKHICERCGFNNDTTFSNVKGQCKDCEKMLSNPDAIICKECKKERMIKAYHFCQEVSSICQDLSSTLTDENKEYKTTIDLSESEAQPMTDSRKRKKDLKEAVDYPWDNEIEPDHPNCPRCNETMDFYGHDDSGDFPFGEGYWECDNCGFKVTEKDL